MTLSWAFTVLKKSVRAQVTGCNIQAPNWTALTQSPSNHAPSRDQEIPVSDPNETNWTAVAARAQAYQALHLADLGKASLLERAKFLMTLGLPKEDVAGMLGSTVASLTVTINTAKRKAKAAGKSGEAEVA